MTTRELRPLERAIVRMDRDGMSVPEIAWRFRRSPGHIERVLTLARIPRSAADSPTVEPLRPVERCVLNARRRGVDRSEIAARMRKSPDHVGRIEQYANYKLASTA